jgi:hypothetical protein
MVQPMGAKLVSCPRDPGGGVGSPSITEFRREILGFAGIL